MGKLKTINMTKTGQNIKHLRKKAGLSVRDIQDTFGFNTPASIYYWQSGRNIPSIDNLVILASLFDVKVDDILILE